MPPPPPPRFNPNRDYVLLNDAEDDATAEEGGAGAAANKRGGATAARLFALSRPEAARISLATALLLVASVAQVRPRQRGPNAGFEPPLAHTGSCIVRAHGCASIAVSRPGACGSHTCEPSLSSLPSQLMNLRPVCHASTAIK